MEFNLHSVRMSLRLLLILSLSVKSTVQFNLTILHTNDVHARFEQFDRGTLKCSEANAAMGYCFGGVARRATVINQIRAEADNVLLLDGGDQFLGTLWFYLYQGEAAAYFMNKLGYDVMALGNHEFDSGPAKLAEFLQLVNFDVVCANIDASEEPINGLFNQTVIKLVAGERIGIVGYLYERTPEISVTGRTRFLDILEEMQREVDVLNQQGINKIIALGHAGIDKDKEIAAKVRGVDIVVGGHTDTFLYTGTPPSTEEPYGNYPIVVKPDHDPSGKVLVVQDYAFGKYLGRLDVEFDNEGRVTSYSGNPILLDDTLDQDLALLAEIVTWGEALKNFSKDVIGKSHVFLEGSREGCRLKECNLGNLVVDAYLWSFITSPDEDGWNDVSIAIQVGGGIRASISQGDVTIGDVSTVLPFENTIDTVELQGRHVRKMLENSVKEYDSVQLRGEFLQVSGILVTYDLSREPGDRLVKVLVRCSQCPIPDYYLLDDDEFYTIAMPSYVANGGDGYDVIKENKRNHNTGFLDTAVLSDYVRQHSPIIAGVERRLTILNGTDNLCNTGSGSHAMPYFLSIITATILAIFPYIN